LEDICEPFVQGRSGEWGGFEEEYAGGSVCDVEEEYPLRGFPPCAVAVCGDTLVHGDSVAASVFDADEVTGSDGVMFDDSFSGHGCVP
jgi:hypothetical protein